LVLTGREIVPCGNGGRSSFARFTISNICSGGLFNAGETEVLEETPEPERISLRIPLIPSRSRVLAPRGDPLAHVERSRIKPVYVGVLREACPPPELLLEMREAACVTSP
jgi:hypothetical protein